MSRNTKNLLIISESNEKPEIEKSKLPTCLFEFVYPMSFSWFIDGFHIVSPEDWIVVCLNSLNKNPDGLVAKLAMFPLNKKLYISKDLPQLAYYTQNQQEKFTSWENLVRREFFVQ